MSVIRKITLDEITALGGPPPHRLTAVEEAFDWSSGSKGPRVGSYYTVLRLIDLEKLRVLVRDTAPAVPPETVAQRASTLQFVLVEFVGLTASASSDKTGNIRIYAEAEAVKVVQPAQK